MCTQKCLKTHESLTKDLSIRHLYSPQHYYQGYLLTHCLSREQLHEHS